MNLKQVALKVQQLMIDSDINVERLVNVPASQLEKGVKRIAIYLDMHVGKHKQKAYGRVAAVLDKSFKMDGSGNYWDGGGDDETIYVIGTDIDDDDQAMVSVEEQTQEYVNSMMGEAAETFKHLMGRA